MKPNVPDEVNITWPKLDSLIISVTAGVVLGLILLARGNTLPMHSPNDLSRWATVYSLAERGGYQIDETPWPPSIDRVQLNGHYYSSKPPLLPTLLAGEYLALKKLSSGKLNFRDTPEAVIRTIVATVNLIPLVIFLMLYSRLLNRLTPEPWVRGYAMVAAALGTYLTGFSVTLNNHTIAAFSSFFAVYPAFLIWSEQQRKWWLFALVGFFAAFTAVNEFPAVSFLTGLAAGLVWREPRRTLRFLLPFALLPVAAHFWTNYRVTGNLKPNYANKAAYDFPGSYWKIDPASGRLVGSRTDPATGQTVIHVSDGIDNQFEPWYLYLFNMLVGHHGIFSLSPIFIFTLIGITRVVGQPENPLRAYGLLVILLTTVLLVFYTFFAGQRNYGGMTNGLRWFFWLIPSWLMFLPFGLHWKGSNRFRGAALILLLVSATSAFYATRNPWTRPWLHQLLYYLGWVNY